MMRSFFVFLSRAAWAQRAITHWKIVRPLTTRFVAGETREDALRAISQLNSQGINASLDHLGENTTSPEAARESTREALEMLEEIDRHGVRANVSIKLSQIGLTIDQDLCNDNLTSLLEKARSLGNFIRIDMEDASLTDRTLGAFFKARQSGFENTGIVIQSYLYRSQADIRKILDISGKVRLCKGAYQESPRVAFPKKKDVDQNFDHLAELLLDGACRRGMPRVSSDGRTPPLPALATHDEQRIRRAIAVANRLQLPKDALEFQMLYGIRRDLQSELAAEGYPMRVYVPYGTHWYPYFMRRLGERPANVWFLASNYFRK